MLAIEHCFTVLHSLIFGPGALREASVSPNSFKQYTDIRHLIIIIDFFGKPRKGSYDKQGGKTFMTISFHATQLVGDTCTF